MNDITFEQAWNYGGPLMWVLALFSVWALALVIYLWYSQRAGIVVPEAVSRICASKDPESEGGRVADRLMSQVEWLADLGAIAPLVGLLGTVLGMFQAFGGIASDVSAGAKPMVLAHLASRLRVLPPPRTAPHRGGRGACRRALRLASGLTPSTRRFSR